MDDYDLKPEPLPPAQAPRPSLAYATPVTHGDPVPVQPGNPLLTIFTRPRATMRWILHYNPTLYVLPIVILGAVLNAFGNIFEQDADGGAAVLFGLVLGLPIAIGVTLLLFYLAAWVASHVGKWLGGSGTPERCRAAMAWAQIPSLAASIVVVPASIVVALVLDVNAAVDPQANLPGFVMLMGVAAIAFAFQIWTLVLLCFTLGEAHRFSTGLGVATVAILIVLFVVAVLAVVVPIALVMA